MPLTRSAAFAAVILGLTAPAYAQPTGGPPPEGRGPDRSQAVELDIADSFDLPEADAHTTALVEAANTFLDTLTEEQRETATFAFDDAGQRGRWSNFPDSLFSRDGLARGDMDDTQRAALDRLLSTLMSARGMQNIRYQPPMTALKARVVCCSPATPTSSRSWASPHRSAMDDAVRRAPPRDQRHGGRERDFVFADADRRAAAADRV